MYRLTGSTSHPGGCYLHAWNSIIIFSDFSELLGSNLGQWISHFTLDKKHLWITLRIQILGHQTCCLLPTLTSQLLFSYFIFPRLSPRHTLFSQPSPLQEREMTSWGHDHPALQAIKLAVILEFSLSTTSAPKPQASQAVWPLYCLSPFSLRDPTPAARVLASLCSQFRPIESTALATTVYQPHGGQNYYPSTEKSSWQFPLKISKGH